MGGLCNTGGEVQNIPNSCFNCKRAGHQAKACPFPHGGGSKPKETKEQGERPVKVTTNLGSPTRTQQGDSRGGISRAKEAGEKLAQDDDGFTRVSSKRSQQENTSKETPESRKGRDLFSVLRDLDDEAEGEKTVPKKDDGGDVLITESPREQLERVEEKMNSTRDKDQDQTVEDSQDNTVRVDTVTLEEEPCTPRSRMSIVQETEGGERLEAGFPIIIRSPTKWADAGDDNDEDVEMPELQQRGMRGRPSTDKLDTPDKGNAVKKRGLGEKGQGYQKVKSFSQLIPGASGGGSLVATAEKEVLATEFKGLQGGVIGADGERISNFTTYTPP
ncbi:hypothetical protein R1sor_025530 [Riccia sorocarpa]|uniref:CCHC-type domain-containing protein n=1 Tax=Riccia sorocarpa TaxID=122646 RepID=A0ABD3GAG0_9MARC